MACNYPIRAYQCVDGTVVFDERKGDVLRALSLPCGKCDGCRLERSRQWAIRCVHEASLYEENCVVSLTYNDEHMPDRRELVYRDFQLFMKRLRKKFGYHLPSRRHHGPIRKIRFFMCGEYGEEGRRPHFHSCLFNIRFPDEVFFKKSKSGTDLFTSATLDSLWSDSNGAPLGFATIGKLDFASAAYIGRYIMKKGRSSDLEYQGLDTETGELYLREKEFTHMSLKPGIGRGFYDKWFTDIYPHDHCIIDGVEMKPPIYYSRRLKVDDPELYEELQFKRSRKALEHSADNTPERLEVKEAVLKAKVKFFLKRDSL